MQFRVQRHDRSLSAKGAVDHVGGVGYVAGTFDHDVGMFDQIVGTVGQ